MIIKIYRSLINWDNVENINSNDRRVNIQYKSGEERYFEMETQELADIIIDEIFEKISKGLNSDCRHIIKKYREKK